MKKQHLRVLLGLIATLLVCLPGVEAKNRKGDKLLKDGQAAEAKGDWDGALILYQQALDDSPTDAEYMIAVRKARFQAGERHVTAGQKLRSEGKIAEALQEFQKALAADPSSGIAIQELRRTQQMLDRSKQGAVKADDVGLTPVEQLRRDEDQRVASIEGPPELKPVIRQVPALKMNNMPPRVLYETVGKLAGINVVFDPTYQPPRPTFNVDLNASDILQAFDYLAVLTHTFWKPMNSNTIFVTDENVTKRRDYEDNVVKTFYVTNATSVQEFQEIANAVRTATTIRQAFTYNAQKALVLRGTVDEMKLAEKLIRDLDKPKAEVVVDVIIMTANTARTRDLAATIATGGTAGLNVPFAFTPRNAITLGGTASSGTGTGTGTGTGSTPTSTAVTLANLGRISTGDFATTLPGALLQAVLSDNRTKVLDSPQVRASDGMKVTLTIGDRIPYATGSFQPGVGTVGVSPLVSTQFNFIDTGTTIAITPQVHSAKEVTLHVELNVNAVKSYVNQGGLAQPVITQNKNDADIRLRDGEVNILSGLTSTQDSSAVNGIPGLVNIPVLGKFLFGSNHTEKDRSELLIALIPHIVRTPDYTPENMRGVYAGSETIVKVNYAPNPADVTPPAPGAAPAAGAVAPAVPPIATPAAISPAPAPAPGGQARLSFAPATIQATRNTPFSLTVQVDNVTDLFSLSPLKIKFDPAQMRLDDIAAGDLLSRDGGRVTTVKDIRNDTGEATLTVTRLPGSSGSSGSGAVAILNFTAVGMGTGTVSVNEASFKNSQLQAVPATLASVPVTVQ